MYSLLVVAFSTNFNEHNPKMSYPALAACIAKRLEDYQIVGNPILLLTSCGVILAFLHSGTPELFTTANWDGTFFKCSDSFVHMFLQKVLGWSHCRSTHTAQKTLKDWLQQCLQSFFQQAIHIQDKDIPAALHVNSNQTQIIIQQ
jgi:hypothetical protein